MTRTPGVEASGGPLGMGLSVAVGMALALKYVSSMYKELFPCAGFSASWATVRATRATVKPLFLIYSRNHE